MSELLLEVKENYLEIKELNFKVKISRKLEKPLKILKTETDFYGKNNFCPPGKFYIFYRLRKEGDRLELSQTKPKEVFSWNHKQGVLFSPKGIKRTNIQIHLGTKSKGCILIDPKKNKEKYFELLKIVANALNKKKINKKNFEIN